MSTGKSSGSETYIPTLSPQQNAQIAAQTGLFTSQIAPAYATAVSGATDLYNITAPGVTAAAQNLAGTAGQAQNVLGSTGESALTSGINALQNIASPEYQQAQLNAALMPGQAQYAQNIAAQGAQFGGAGQIGSARQALAQRQTAGSAMAQQQQAAAGVLQNIAGQQLAAGGQLSQLGQAGLGGAQTAAGQQLTASMAPQALYNQYASVLFGTPSASYNPNFAGTQSGTTDKSGSTSGMDLGVLFKSDIRAKENIKFVTTEHGHKMYEFNYKDRPERYRGVMAQDVMAYAPEAVVVDKDGYLMVNYSMLGVSMTQIGEGE
jgi:hypothetical protein